MSKFPNKTPETLRQYFREKNLEQLIEINHSYGPHFENLEKRIDRLTQKISTSAEKLSSLLTQKVEHGQNYDKMIDEQQIYENNRSSIMSDSSTGAERYLALSFLSTSPFDYYQMRARTLEDEIDMTNKKLNELNTHLAFWKNQRSKAVSELKILNPIIDEKRRELEVAPQFTLSSN
ncbi:TPA: hypothetical protein ACT9LC_001435 [Legionella pneumophila]|nr:hypothetical protein [Legionella pneumophila]AOW59630.1 hypothetical protein BE843_12685 [Legionella pneumophila subsp. pneumophila]AOW60757.1 hypothetical protein BE844_06085 [Legionella pneumophila subsp. pneumophila]AOW66155.1 hypothetical protein BE846_03850 [Legionella pneumophila subsp. pneumophila]HBB6938388.1 hypothetical protein [Legionella pneumophila]HBD9218059.1 hypothetical protein [Legionella pneumophila]